MSFDDPKYKEKKVRHKFRCPFDSDCKPVLGFWLGREWRGAAGTHFYLILDQSLY